MTSPTCRCGKPTTGPVLCDQCAFLTLAIALANVAAYHADLDVLRARRHAVRYDLPRGKGGTKELPLVVDARFADKQRRNKAGQAVGDTSRGTVVSDDTRNTVTAWVRVVAEHWPAITAPVCDDGLCRRCQPLRAEAHLRRPPADTVSSCCAYLVRMLRHIAGAEWAPQLLDELLDVETRLRRFVDIPADQWYAGPCTAGQTDLSWTALCGAELFAVMGHDEVTCRECGWVYPLDERRAWLLAAAEDRLETAATIAGAVVVLADYARGESRLVQRISDWRARGRLEVRDTVLVKGVLRPRYRVGDVLDLIADDTRDDVLKRARVLPSA